MASTATSERGTLTTRTPRSVGTDYMANPPFNVSKVDKRNLKTTAASASPTTDNANYLWIQPSALSERPGGLRYNSFRRKGSGLEIRRQSKHGCRRGRCRANMFYTVTLPVTLWFDRAKPADRVRCSSSTPRDLQHDRSGTRTGQDQVEFLQHLRLYRRACGVPMCLLGMPRGELSNGGTQTYGTV